MPGGGSEEARLRRELADTLKSVQRGCSSERVARLVAELSARVERTELYMLAHGDSVHTLSAVLKNEGYPTLAVDVDRAGVKLADTVSEKLVAVKHRSHLAVSLMHSGEPQEAMRVLARANQDNEKLGCPDPSMSIILLKTSSEISMLTGRPRDATDSLRQALALSERTQGPRALETIEAKTQLACSLIYSEPFEARKMLEELVPFMERLGGPDFGGTINVRMRLGQAAAACGDVAAAAAVLRPTIAAAERIEGPNSNLLHTGACGLAEALRDSTNPAHVAESEQLYRKVLGISTRVHGRKSYHTYMDISNLSVVLMRQGKLAEAEALLHVLVKDEGVGPSIRSNARENLLDIQRAKIVEEGGAAGERGAATDRAVRDIETLLAGGTPDPFCAICGSLKRADGSDKSLYSCAACGVVRYCSPECQKKGWKEGHKQACTKARKESKAGPEGKGPLKVKKEKVAS